jgi:hydroxypyruvate isomerase
MASTQRWNRRTVVQAAGIGTLAALVRPGGWVSAAEKRNVKGNIKQSLCRWCYKDIPLEKLAAEAKRIGYRSIELLSPDEFKVVKPYGLTCAMLSGACTIPDCLNRKENHAEVEKKLRDHIEFAAANDLPNVICFSGNRRGMSDEEGLANCAEGLKRIVGFAEQKRSTGAHRRR